MLTQTGLSAVNQLPADLSDFTGRRKEVRSLLYALEKSSTQRRRVPALCVIHGSPGLGTSTLASHLAQRVKSLFPDGQLYADLRGAGEHPAEAIDVLGGLLIGLGGLDSPIPSGLEAQVSLYRARLHCKQMLIVLDNVRDADQIRPLIPVEVQCAVIAVGTHTLTDLAVTTLKALPALHDDEALALLKRMIGFKRVQAEAQAARHLVGVLCGGAPLAIRLCAGLLVSRGISIAELSARLQEQRRRLVSLQSGDLDHRASFLVGYDELSPLDRHLFRCIGLLASPRIRVPVAAAFLDVDLIAAQAALDRLVEAGMAERTITAGAYRLPGLLHRFARELDIEEEAEEARQAAWVRAAFLYLLDAAHLGAILQRESPTVSAETVLMPDEPIGPLPRTVTRLEAFAWFIEEFENVLLAIEAGRWAELWKPVADACIGLAGFLKMRGITDLVRRVYGYALQAAEMLGDRESEGRALLGLTECDRADGQWDQAMEHGRRSLNTARDHRLRTLEVASHISLAVTYRRQGQLDQAIEAYKQSAQLAREIGDADGEAAALSDLGGTYRLADRVSEAVSCYQACLTIRRAQHDLLGEAVTQLNLGNAFGRREESEEAIQALHEALRIFTLLDDPLHLAGASTSLGGAYRRAGQPAAALGYLAQGAQLAQALGDRHGEGVALLHMGYAYLDLGQREPAAAFIAQAGRLLQPDSTEAKQLAEWLSRAP